MATAQVSLGEDFTLRIDSLSAQFDGIAKQAIEAGGKVALAAVKSHLSGAIGQTGDSRSTGELLGSLGLTPVKRDKDGRLNAKVGFNEPRRKQYAARKRTKSGKPSRKYYTLTNAMIANVLEYGKHGQPGTRFLKKAYITSRGAVTDAMRAKLEEGMS